MNIHYLLDEQVLRLAGGSQNVLWFPVNSPGSNLSYVNGPQIAAGGNVVFFDFRNANFSGMGPGFAGMLFSFILSNLSTLLPQNFYS